MYSTEINLNTLKAVSLAASTEETRYYLNGVCVECYADHVLYIATNGHIMVVAREELSEPEAENTLLGTWILPLDVCKIGGPKRGVPTVALTADSLTPAKLTLGDRIVTPIDGTFPDWRRVVPGKPGEMKGEKPIGHAHFNPDYVALMGKVAKLFGGNASCAVIQEAAPNNPHAVLFSSKLDAFGVIMPMRAEVDQWQGMPDWAKRADPEESGEAKNEAAIADESENREASESSEEAV
jgi:DNA polymerase-3 subunit beta